MKQVKRISKKQLLDMLLNWKYGAQPASIQYLTTPELNKEGLNKFGNVFKLASVGVMLGYIYENSVNNELKKQSIEQGFLTNPLWHGKGKRINPLISQHIETNQYYISYKYQQTFKSYYFDDKLNKINVNDINMYLRNNNKPKIENDINSNLNNTNNNKPNYKKKLIEHREISINNIKKLKFKKTTYIIK